MRWPALLGWIARVVVQGRRTRAGAFAMALIAGGAAMAVPVAARSQPSVVVGVPPGPVAPSSPTVQLELIAERAAVEPGTPFWVGVRQRIAPGWHTYWLNPGDSGEPMTIEWALPPGFSAGAIAWPHPERLPVGPAMTFGYSQEVVLPVRITAPTALDPGTRITLSGHAAWLVCEKICLPEEADVRLTLPVASGAAPANPGDAAAIASALRSVPVPSPWPASFSATAEAITLDVAAPGLAPDRVADVYFYPSAWGAIELPAPQHVTIGDRGITLRVARGPLVAAAEAPIDGVLVITERLDRGESTQAFSVRATPERGLLAGVRSPALSLLAAVGLALAGGLILNLMPCVLPVLSVKALSLLQHADDDDARLRRHGLAYTAGVLASFAIVAGVLIGLRSAGARIGWGFQLQSPVFVTLLAYVFFALALSLSGALLIGGRAASLGRAMAARPGYTGAFFTGALATVAATPCTAPFMGVAVGFALTEAPGMALLVFEALGLGLALPYLLLSLMPRWRRFLPRPGAWMERLKQLLAFPLYATAAWLVWVVSQQAGPAGVAAALAGLVLIAFAAWLYTSARDAGRGWRRLAIAGSGLAVIAAIALAPMLAAGPTSLTSRIATPSRGVVSEPFSPKRLAELRAEGRPVFVNFTAAWCITCLVNERVALSSAAVTEAFSRKDVAYLKGDWTTRDAAIAQVLGSFGRSGVPLYLFYAAARAGEPTGAPRILPQILSERMIIDAIDKT